MSECLVVVVWIIMSSTIQSTSLPRVSGSSGGRDKPILFTAIFQHLAVPDI